MTFAVSALSAQAPALNCSAQILSEINVSTPQTQTSSNLHLRAHLINTNETKELFEGKTDKELIRKKRVHCFGGGDNNDLRAQDFVFRLMAQPEINSFNDLKGYFDMKNELKAIFEEMDLLTFNPETQKINIHSNSLLVILFYVFSNKYALLMDILGEDLNTELNFKLNVSLNEAINNVLSDWLPMYELAHLFNNVLNLIRKMTKTRFSNQRRNFFILAIHEVFDSFLRAFNDLLREIIDENNIGDNEDINFYDLDTIPYHRTKTPLLPRGVKINDLLKNFLYDDVLMYYSHQIQDFQPEEYENNKNEVMTQAIINTINDFIFYVRIMPTINLEMVNNELFNIHGASKTRNAILKRYMNQHEEE